MAYDLRARKVKNYKEVANIECCKVGTRKRPREEKLYELEVIEKDRQNRHVKVHYVGYESEYDEWRDEDVKIIYLVQDFPAPFHPHNELKYQIKVVLKPSGRADPVNRIEVPFDYYTFMGGLSVAGKVRHESHGSEIYGIDSYSDLIPFLGEKWPIRILNEENDFCYAILDTIEYHLHSRRPIIDSYEPLVAVDGGYSMIFCFVRGDGVNSDLSRITGLL